MNRRIYAFAIGLMLLSLPFQARAADVVWNEPKTIAEFDCGQLAGTDRIVIAGTVKLAHPDDADLRSPAKYIKIVCANLKFENSAKVQSDSSLDFIIGNLVSGPVFIESTRGRKGEDGEPAPDVWRGVAAASGLPGLPGVNGSDGDECWKIGPGPDPGGEGGAGGRGAEGRNGESGSDGKSGFHGANIRLIAGAFDQDATFEANSVGGDGGRGGSGGRGQDGGVGGPGGRGGQGGDGRGCHEYARGGRGGAGGNGGNGGNGGRGGAGGDGGHGGDIRVGLKAAGSGLIGIPKFNVDGGAAGFGGKGGQPGSGGAPGRAGPGGPKPIYAVTVQKAFEGKEGAAGRAGTGAAEGMYGRVGSNGTLGTIAD